MSDISLTVLNDMRLMITPEEVARDSEHNSAVFRVVAQPSSLDALACRAEVMTSGGTTYRLVENGEFSLTNDIAVRGLGRIQLVYSDGVDVTRKTSVAGFHVTGSLNAVDESAPGFGDGLAQLQGRCFAEAQIAGTTLNFYNLGGQLVSSVTSPAGGVEEVPAGNGAYARFRGAGGTSWQDFTTLGVAGLFSPQFTGNPTAPTPVAGTSDTTLATTQYVYRDFLPRAGGQMSGPLIAASGGSLTNMGLAIGENSTGFYRTGNVMVLGVSGAFILQYTVDSMMMAAQIIMGNQRITTLADATQDQDALNRRTADARYLPRSGGALTGTLTTVPGTGQNNLGLGIGDGNTGFYRNGPGAGADLMTLVGGYPILMLTNARDVLINGPLNMGTNRIMAVGDATAATDALNLQTGDARYGRAPSLVVNLPGNQTFTGATFVNLMPITFAIPRGGNSRIQVSVVLDCSLPGDSQIAVTGVACDSAPGTIRRGFLYQLNGACNGVVAQFVFDVAGTSVGPFNVQCANLSTGPGGGAVSWTALAGSQAVVTDLGPR
jgi:hypothetical protein